MKKKKTGRIILFVIIALLLVIILMFACSDDEESYSDDNYYEYSDNNSSDDEYNYDGQETYDSDEWDSGYEASELKYYDGWDDSVSYDFAGNLGSQLGSASELSGRTVIVSIFADDNNTSWKNADKTKTNTIKYMKVATDWIVKQCSNYGVSSEFVYDWSENEDLYYTAGFAMDMTNTDSDLYYEENAYINQNVDTAAIVEKYNPNNVIYILFVNTPLSAHSASATFSYEEDDPSNPNEIITMYVFCDGEEEAPSTYAHEMLHAFGAPDLYMVDTDGSNYGITQEFVDMLEYSYSNDIMYTTYDAKTQQSYYDHVSNELSEMDAYYVGLTDHSDVVEEWGFSQSQH